MYEVVFKYLQYRELMDLWFNPNTTSYCAYDFSIHDKMDICFCNDIIQFLSIDLRFN